MPEPVKLRGMNYEEQVREITAKRNAEILAMRKQGATLQAIGDAHGLSRERIRQIVAGCAVLKGAKP